MFSYQLWRSAGWCTWCIDLVTVRDVDTDNSRAHDSRPVHLASKWWHDDNSADNSFQNHYSKRDSVLACKFIPELVIRDASISRHGPHELGCAVDWVAKRAKLSHHQDHQEEGCQGSVRCSQEKGSYRHIRWLKFLDILYREQGGDTEHDALHDGTRYGYNDATWARSIRVLGTLCNVCTLYIP